MDFPLFCQDVFAFVYKILPLWQGVKKLSHMKVPHGDHSKLCAGRAMSKARSAQERIEIMQQNKFIRFMLGAGLCL
jgi:hypothetical protein